MNRRPHLLALTLLATLVLPHALPAQEGHGTVTVQDLMGGDDPRLEVSLKEARERVLDETGGKLVSSKTIRLEGVFVHRIVVITPAGEELTYDIDAGLAQ